MAIFKKIMMKFGSGFDDIAYESNYEHIAKSNIKFYKLYNIIMILLLAMLYISTFYSDYAKELRYVYIVFLSVSIVEIFLLKKGVSNTLPRIKSTIYYGIIKSYIFCLLSSVIYNRNDYAITFFIFMILLPISFVLKPVIIVGIQTFAMIVFCVASFLYKSFDIAMGDMLACIVFYVIAFVIAGQINHLRINNIQLITEQTNRNLTLEDQHKLLGVSLEVAKLCNVSEEDFRHNISKIINIVQKQYEANRSYIFEFDWNENLMSNTYECVAENISEEKQNLQNLPVDIISYWIPFFRAEKEVFIEDIELLKNDVNRKTEYKTLKAQDITELIVVPISREGHLYGYIGVDDPKIHKMELGFILNVAQLLSQEFFSCEQQRKLEKASLNDALTGLKNRYSYELYLQELSKKEKKNVGVIFADVNGLKFVNDTYGHIKGDIFINDAANVLRKFMPEHGIFRISGDEFVVIWAEVEEKVFTETVLQMKKYVTDECDSIFSAGSIWSENESVINMIRIAEKNMYNSKKKYYKANPDKNRRELIDHD